MPSNWQDYIAVLTQQNPLNFNIERYGQVYDLKIKRFLQDCARVMTAETPWTGLYDATGGQIVVNKDGDIVCYHVYELNRFLNYRAPVEHIPGVKFIDYHYTNIFSTHN